MCSKGSAHVWVLACIVLAAALPCYARVKEKASPRRATLATGREADGELGRPAPPVP